MLLAESQRVTIVSSCLIRYNVVVLSDAYIFVLYHLSVAGFLATSSALTIGQNADMTSENLTAQAQAGGFWKEEDGPIDFVKAFSSQYEGISLSDKQKPENRLNFIQNMLRSISDEGKETKSGTRIVNILQVLSLKFHYFSSLLSCSIRIKKLHYFAL